MKFTDFGPFISAICSAIIASALLMILAMGLKVEMNVFLVVFVPGMTLSALMVAVSMGWIFILVGRLHRTPRLIPATIIITGFAMMELLLVTIALGRM